MKRVVNINFMICTLVKVWALLTVKDTITKRRASWELFTGMVFFSCNFCVSKCIGLEFGVF